MEKSAFHGIFIQAINDKKAVKIEFNSKDKGDIVRTCIPFDFGPSRIYQDGLDRYHLLDIDSTDGKHNLSLLPEVILKLEIIQISFDPANYVKWQPKWFISRDWGRYS